MLSFLKTVLFRDSHVSNPLYTNRESSWFGLKHLLETRKREPCPDVAAGTWKGLERTEKRK